MDAFKTVVSSDFTWFHSDKALSKAGQIQLYDQFGFLKHHIANTDINKNSRPKIIAKETYTCLVLHIPYLPVNSSRARICDLTIFVTKKAIITVESLNKLKTVEELFEQLVNNPQLRDQWYKNGSVKFAIKLITQILEDAYNFVDKQGEKIDELDSQIFKQKKSQTFLETASVLRFNQIVSISAMERQFRLFEQFSGEKQPFIFTKKGPGPRWQGVVELFEVLADELNGDSKHLDNLVQTFETLVSHRTNETIKFLTIFSVVLLPLTLLSGIFGMNFKNIPMTDHPLGFFGLIVIMITLLLGMVGLFKLKKWL